ncbi:aspartate/glutamate racemase family protein [Polaribacter sargassicola]|uniref:aspartate/glutamate racemase family protein n=1 Tax=Polaribacter sargassicola TaxID=2836891 RepID=UPI001F01C2FC|nr:amino acid racemase [Polaribacter sp. DS7-9]MCG1037397.1 amino acid racemase [Polaribacter sp. DS7-9]
MKKAFLKKISYAMLFFILISCNKVVDKTKTIISTKREMEQNKLPHQKMNTLGLIGGTSWHSTIEYYAAINQSINDYYGNNTNPPLLVYTINQAEVHRLQKIDEWNVIAALLKEAAIGLHNGGATSVMFCANTPHKVFDVVQNQLDFPIIHIGDATAKSIKNKGVKSVAFLGTIYTMEANFITKRIEDNGVEVFVPEEKEVLIELQRIIEEELTYGVIKPVSKTYVLNVIQDLVEKGAEGVVLGCTEFPLMIFDEDLKIPIFNTTKIHSEAAVDYILNK